MKNVISILEKLNFKYKEEIIAKSKIPSKYNQDWFDEFTNPLLQKIFPKYNFKYEEVLCVEYDNNSKDYEYTYGYKGDSQYIVIYKNIPILKYTIVSGRCLEISDFLVLVDFNLKDTNNYETI